MVGENQQASPWIQPKKKILEPILPLKQYTFPIYAVFGDGHDKWEVCILRGHGHVELIKTYTINQIVKDHNELNKGKKKKNLSKDAAYLLVHRELRQGSSEL